MKTNPDEASDTIPNSTNENKYPNDPSSLGRLILDTTIHFSSFFMRFLKHTRNTKWTPPYLLTQTTGLREFNDEGQTSEPYQCEVGSSTECW